MCSAGTSSPVSSETFWYLMRDFVRSSSWLNETPWWRTAVNSLTGMEISPKLIVPLQIDRAIGLDGTCSVDQPTQADWAKPSRREGRWTGRERGRSVGGRSTPL